MSKIGVSKFYYGIQTAEETATTAATYATPVAIPGLVSVEVTPSSNTSTLYADNGPYETASSLGEIALSIDLADLPLADQAALLGHTLTSGQLDKSANDTQPNVAVMFEFLLGNGKKRAVKLYKGKFALVPEQGNTRGENVEFQTNQMTASFVQLKNNGLYESVKDFDADASTDTWYASVLS